jgi:DNA helicase-2/ATP-dependent DNA helicase PcrA
MSNNRLFIAAAGSGKTTLIINEVLANKTDKILITTFTIANAQSIRAKLTKENGGSIPTNVTVQTWFSFLLEHGIRPYRFWNDRVVGLKLVQEKSGLRYTMKNGTKVYWAESDNFEQYYFSRNMDVYSDKIAKLVLQCNKKSNGSVIERLSKIFTQIYIDEVQDMTGWDLELSKLFIRSSMRFTMVGDPRQAVYSTHPDVKNKKYANGKIKVFIETECKGQCQIDEKTLLGSKRNAACICALSSALYHTEYTECQSLLELTSSHTGIFFVKQSDVENYVQKCDKAEHDKDTEPHLVQLRTNKQRPVSPNAPVMNFGISKGLQFHHVLIYPTKPILAWILDHNNALADSSRADFYVALTRAFFSVGIVVPDVFDKSVDGIEMWSCEKCSL